VVTKAYINPKLLTWARERQGYSPAEAAARFHVSQDVVEEWEQGTSLPTLNQAQAVANSLSVPFGYLYLSEPPAERLPIPDLRRVAGEPAARPSPELRDLVADAWLKQAWYREYLEGEGAEPLPFIGRYSTHDSPELIAAEICQTIGIDSELRKEVHSWDEYLRKLVERVEAAGIIVLRSGIVYNNSRRALDPVEFRGFAISDPLAPLIFINGKDYRAAQIFTLAHELAHLWIGSSGIDKPEIEPPHPERLPAQQGDAVELFANRVAAEVLVPSGEFASRWSEAESPEANRKRLATHFRVSEDVILHRSYDLKKINYDQYQEGYRILRSRPIPPRLEGSGGNSYANLLVRNSKTLTRTLLAAVAAGDVSFRDAARLLHVKVQTLGGLSQFAFE
jgi:Zn-dependent peptidase ImmA (M78 family)/DNA-binding XRE family transcriptional regulator